MTASWSVSPYVVGLLLDAPAEQSTVLVAAFTEATTIGRSLGLPGHTTGGASVHAVWLTHRAVLAEQAGRHLDAEWLARAAERQLADAAYQLADQLADQLPGSPEAAGGPQTA